MNDPFKKILLILSVLISASLFSQHKTAEYFVTFDNLNSEAQIRTSEYIPIITSSDYSFIGLSGFEDMDKTPADLSYRTKSGNNWSEWQHFNTLTENVDVNRRTYEGEPILDRIEFIQFASTTPGNVTFRLFIADGDLEQSETLNNPQSEGCDCAQPDYCDRDCWCPSGDCEPMESPAETIPTHVIVHHSAGFGSSNNFQAVVAYYYDLHVFTNGWNDLGYNWLIDANGVVYEARGAGTQGAHFNCVNGATSGICLIGNFMEEAPTEAAMQTLETLIAWEFCSYDITPNMVAYHEPSELQLETISTHKDGNPSPSASACNGGTVCPGDVLYDMLDVTRLNIADLDCLNPFTSISELYKEKIEVYPNPFVNKVKIKFANDSDKNNAQYYLTDVHSNNINFTSERTNGPVELNFQNLSSGMYFLHIQLGEEKLTYKLIKN